MAPNDNRPTDPYTSGSNAAVETLLTGFTDASKFLFKQRKTLLSFADFLTIVQKNPRSMIRNSSSYLRDVFDHFGRSDSKVDGGRSGSAHLQGLERFKIFDIGTERQIPIIGGESVQKEFYNILQAFVRQGVSNKLIMLHGPNGSAKTSTIEAIAHAMQQLVESPSLATQFRTQGLMRSRHYSWQNCAKQTSEIYQRMLGLIK